MVHTEELTCPSCGTWWQARVWVDRPGNFGIDAGASAAAFGSWAEECRLLVHRAPCPQCGHRRGGVVELVSKTVLVLGVAAWAAWRYLGPISGKWWAGVAVLLIPIVITVRLGSAQSRVRFRTRAQIDRDEREAAYVERHSGGAGSWADRD